MGIWLNHVREASVAGEPCVAVMVAAVRGSAPREPGAAMMVTPSRVIGTIGGGNLEFVAIERAREILAGGLSLANGGDVRRYVLGTTLGQCCGGAVYLHFETFAARLPRWMEALAEFHRTGRAAVLLSHGTKHRTQRAILTSGGFEGDKPVDDALDAAAHAARSMLDGPLTGQDLIWLPEGCRPSERDIEDFVLMRPVLVGDFRVVVFGAGHVGRALVRVLEPLVDQIVWSDGREGEFPSVLPANARVDTGDPFAIIDSMPAASLYLVMTHSHALDLALCEAVLQRGDQAYLGLIGSKSKRRRFEKHLRGEGLTEDDLQGLICPIGVDGIRSKQPASIAVSVAAQLLRVVENLRGRRKGSEAVSAL